MLLARKNWSSHVGVAVFALVFGVMGNAWSTTLVSLSLDDMINSADLIVQGRVVDVQSSETARGRVVTDATVQVERYLLRSGPEQLTVRTLGGEVEGRAVYTAGAARLEAGEEYVLFLFNKRWRDGSEHYLVVGMLQGRFPLAIDPISGERFVTRSLEGVIVVDPAGAQPRSSNELAGSIYLSLSRFVEEIKKRTATRR